MPVLLGKYSLSAWLKIVPEIRLDTLVSVFLEEESVLAWESFFTNLLMICIFIIKK